MRRGTKIIRGAGDKAASIAEAVAAAARMSASVTMPLSTPSGVLTRALTTKAEAKPFDAKGIASEVTGQIEKLRSTLLGACKVLGESLLEQTSYVQTLKQAHLDALKGKEAAESKLAEALAKAEAAEEHLKKGSTEIIERLRSLETQMNTLNERAAAGDKSGVWEYASTIMKSLLTLGAFAITVLGTSILDKGTADSELVKRGAEMVKELTKQIEEVAKSLGEIWDKTVDSTAEAAPAGKASAIARAAAAYRTVGPVASASRLDSDGPTSHSSPV